MTPQAAAGGPQLAAWLTPGGDRGELGKEKVELWPSIGEYPVYDELIYHGLSSDEHRNAKYKAALEGLVVGKVVVDVGTGADAVLARLAVDAGARKVYAVEVFEPACRRAQATVERLGLGDRITVVRGDARTVELPEKADVCVSEIVEAIGAPRERPAS